MMPFELAIVLRCGFWALIAVAVGAGVYRFTAKRRYQFLATLIVLLAPLWDVAPGYWLFRRAVAEVGGIRVHETVRAEGYLDSMSPDCLGCWRSLSLSPYRYLEIELHVPDASLGSLTATPGYYQYSLGRSGEPECSPFDGLRGADAIRWRMTLDDAQCVVAIRRDQPVSRYEFAGGIARFAEWFPGVRLSWRAVRDRATGKNIAEATQVVFRGWLAGVIGFPIWSYTETKDGTYIEIRVEQIIQPINETQQGRL